MLKFKKIALLLVFSLVFALHVKADETRFVKDSDGNDIKIPLHVNKVAPLIGAFGQMTAMLGYTDKMVATVQKFPDMFYVVFPQINKSNPNAMLSSNVETLILSGAQVVYGPTSFFFNEAQTMQLNAANISVVNIGSFSTIDEMKTSLTMIADILGEDAPKKAKEFNEYYDNNIKKVAERTKDLKNRPKVMSLNFSGGNYATVNDTDIGAVYIGIAGGKNVAGDFRKEGSGMMIVVSSEQILLWNPDIIITSGHSSKDQILQDKALSSINAVKNGKVYVVPTGVYLWSVRSAEGALQPLWLAKQIHPELFTDIDMEYELKNFYEKFYSYKLSNEQAKTILDGRTGTMMR
ncbi:MAG: ABC transporter substrate-binding protein [Campylobacteraceae bacterium]